jgi:hypothetical protein
VLRAVADPLGRCGHGEWRFPREQAPVAMLSYIGKTVDACELLPDQHLRLWFGEDHFTIPLDDSWPGLEAAHLIGIDEDGNTDRGELWVW